jgi:hypothetical protein
MSRPTRPTRRDPVARRPLVARRPPVAAVLAALVLAGAQYVFVGPRTGLRGPPKVVMVLANHDDHLHLRLPPAPRGRR